MSCVFCAIVAKQAPASVAFENDAVIVFADIAPVNPGHQLVVPKVHAVGLADLAPATGAEMFRVAQRVARAIRRSELRCEGINLFLADGAAAFQEVFHAHLHVLPRYRGDGFHLETGQSTTVAYRAELDAVAATIRGHLEE
jgi:histidine triad (HIT) family protein